MQPKTWNELQELCIQLKSRASVKTMCNSPIAILHVKGYMDLEVPYDYSPLNDKGLHDAVTKLYRLCKEKLNHNDSVMKTITPVNQEVFLVTSAGDLAW